jgi:sulfotransferase family protein
MTYVPVSIDWVRAQVELLDLGSDTFDEPFFGDTVERTRREHPAEVPLTVDLPSFVLRAERYPAPPDALVFHVGRCGSTLLTNMLVRSGDYIAVKEPEILNELVAAWLASPDEQRRPMELVTAATVRILLGSIDSPRRRILKLAAWNVQMATALLAMFRTTAAAFVFRSPHETVASQLHKPPAWFDIIDAPRRTQTRYFPSIAEVPDTRPVSPTVLFAHAWRSAVEAARSVPAGRLVYVGYDDLVEESAATLRQLLDRWGCPHDDDVLGRMLGALSIHSKDPKGCEQFEPLGSHRRPALSMMQRREVDVVAGDLWRELRPAH